MSYLWLITVILGFGAVLGDAGDDKGVINQPEATCRDPMDRQGTCVRLRDCSRLYDLSQSVIKTNPFEIDHTWTKLVEMILDRSRCTNLKEDDLKVCCAFKYEF